MGVQWTMPNDWLACRQCLGLFYATKTRKFCDDCRRKRKNQNEKPGALMTLILDRSKAIPGGKIEIKTENRLGPNEFLHLTAGGYVHIDDAVAMIEYILTNTDLFENDPRLELAKKIKAMRVCHGYNIDHDPKSRRFVVVDKPKKYKRRKGIRFGWDSARI